MKSAEEMNPVPEQTNEQKDQSQEAQSEALKTTTEQEDRNISPETEQEFDQRAKASSPEGGDSGSGGNGPETPNPEPFRALPLDEKINKKEDEYDSIDKGDPKVIEGMKQKLESRGIDASEMDKWTMKSKIEQINMRDAENELEAQEIFQKAKKDADVFALKHKLQEKLKDPSQNQDKGKLYEEFIKSYKDLQDRREARREKSRQAAEKMKQEVSQQQQTQKKAGGIVDKFKSWFK